MTLPGQHVTQYMYVLFDQVHIYIQKPLFTFGFASKTSRCHALTLESHFISQFG